MKNLFILFLFLPVFLFSQDDDVFLIKPIIESPVLNQMQANKIASEFDCMNWGVKEIDLFDAIKEHQATGIKICIADTGRPTHKLIRIAGSANFTDNPTHDDKNGHSTHVAGIIQEIAPNAELYFAKVLSNTGSGSMSGVRDGIDWCTSIGADFTNMSLGSPNESSILKTALIRAKEANNIVVAAAGNDGYNETREMIGYPARDETVICVGSTKKGIQVSDFSSSGEFGDIMAPGERILSTYLNQQFVELSGTSMAAPFITGVLALRKSQTNKINDDKSELKESAYDMLDVGYDRKSFYGSITNKIFLDSIPPTEPIEPKPIQKIGKIPLAVIAVFAILIVLFFAFRGRNN